MPEKRWKRSPREVHLSEKERTEKFYLRKIQKRKQNLHTILHINKL